MGSMCSLCLALKVLVCSSYAMGLPSCGDLSLKNIQDDSVLANPHSLETSPPPLLFIAHYAELRKQERMTKGKLDLHVMQLLQRCNQTHESVFVFREKPKSEDAMLQSKEECK